MELIQQAWKIQILPDSFQRWHVSSVHSLLIPNILKKKNETVLTKKIYYPNHMRGLSQLIYLNVKIFLISNILRIHILVSIYMHIYKATYTKYR